MADDDLKLNTLDRFRKTTGVLALEEYSHCEVPAGCGGVIIRWRDPRDGDPMLVQLVHDGEAELYFNGERLRGPAFAMKERRGLLAIALKVRHPGVIARLLVDRPGLNSEIVWEGVGFQVSDVPCEGWMLPETEVDWPIAVEGTLPEEGGVWRWTRAQQDGATIWKVPQRAFLRAWVTR